MNSLKGSGEMKSELDLIVLRQRVYQTEQRRTGSLRKAIIYSQLHRMNLLSSNAADHKRNDPKRALNWVVILALLLGLTVVYPSAWLSLLFLIATARLTFILARMHG